MWIDILIVVFLAVCMIDGWKDGFLRSLTSFMSWVIAAAAGLLFLDRAEAFLANVLRLDMLIQRIASAEAADIALTVISFAAVVFIVKVAVEIIASVLKVVNRIPVLGLLNRTAGAVLGAGKFIIILWILVALIVPHGGTILMDACEDSRIAATLCEYNPLMGIL
ncbi:MAG: CvpA family protein [Clostridiales bacterium]|nr:CvpA family protein [Clostridiales bacterium]